VNSRLIIGWMKPLRGSFQVLWSFHGSSTLIIDGLLHWNCPVAALRMSP